jgi:hypothetical protein
VIRKTTRAIQFCGSEIVQVRAGGRKKKLKHAVAINDVYTEYLRPQAAAIVRTATKNVKATVVGLTCKRLI